MELKIQKKTSVDKSSQPGIVLTEAAVRVMIETAKAEVRADMDRQMQVSQASYITVFGIFASITSFLTIEFQFLKGLVNINQVIGFTFILCALLFGFNMALDYLVKSRLDEKNLMPNIFFTIVSILLFVAGIVFIVCGNSSVNY